ncbi:undecaprenyl-diphosphate phosphatase [Quadrisphaera sp. DSM 44207]|uniref:undecaprenyl-diphosphate phosphatase n=1 Tax=Quadrisphaera sp. DSM 44207 TaxID=1881057 RepID=UPI000890765A|nr:undecaprenyl-diphosphate phosphatase [Quadrisphaera sp. DSM 44207]SDQ41054.1 Undecaprenyl-diphosphatase [Quadrisphaera sp. DSM 44207]
MSAGPGWVDAAILGLVQGLTEFLPISSSAHLSVVGQLIGSEDPGAAFTAIAQLGTEAAVLVYFRRDIWRIARAWVLAQARRLPQNHPDARMGWLVIIGSLPIGFLGYAFQDAIEGPAVRNLWLTATMLWVFAVVLHVADRRALARRTLDELGWRDGLLFGLAQSAALVPGVSRSGGTIAAGLLMGYTREAAARYSFLLAIPAVLASGGLQVAKGLEDLATVAWGPTLLATAIAGGVGYAVIAWLLRYISSHDFRPFVLYRVALAAVVYALLGTGVLTASGA